MVKIERITIGKITHDSGSNLEVPVNIELTLYDINRKKKTLKYEYHGLQQNTLSTYIVDMDINLFPLALERNNLFLKLQAFGNYYFVQNIIIPENPGSRLDLELILNGPLVNWTAKFV